MFKIIIGLILVALAAVALFPLALRSGKDLGDKFKEVLDDEEPEQK